MARILQVCNTDFYLSKFLAPLVDALVARGHEVECVCEGTAIDKGLIERGVAVHPFAFPRGGSPIQFARAIGRMRKLIRAGPYDCVNGHNRNASIVARVAAWLENTPVNLYTAHGFYFHDDQGRLGHSATVVLEAALTRITDFTLSQSGEDAAFMIRHGHIRAEFLEVIGNGIDTRRFRPRPQDREALERDLGLRPGKFRIASTGRLVSGKGFGDLLAAFANLRIPDSELIIVGGNIAQDISPYQAEFLAQAKNSGVADDVLVTGITDRVADYLNTCDVFVLPSYREGLPRSLLEAMATELAVVATDIRGCREVIAHGKSGFLFPPHDIAGLGKIIRDLSSSKELRKSLGENARERIVTDFDERDYVAKQVNTIERLLHAIPPESTSN